MDQVTTLTLMVAVAPLVFGGMLLAYPFWGLIVTGLAAVYGGLYSLWVLPSVIQPTPSVIMILGGLAFVGAAGVLWNVPRR